MPLVLYQLGASPPCRTVLMTMEMLGLKPELKTIDVVNGEQFKADFLEKNHLHTVPLLVDDDFSLADSHAIITYLVSRYGKETHADLYPNDLRIRAKIDEKLYLDTGILFPRMSAAIDSLEKDKAARATSADITSLEESYEFVEKYLQNSPYLVTDHVTLADVACVSSVTSLHCLVPIDDRFVKLKEWIERLKQYDWYQKNVPGLADFDNIFKSMRESNARLAQGQ